jgi:hypothetical protein
MSADDIETARFFLEVFLLVAAIGIVILLVDHRGPGGRK